MSTGQDIRISNNLDQKSKRLKWWDRVACVKLFIAILWFKELSQQNTVVDQVSLKATSIAIPNEAFHRVLIATLRHRTQVGGQPESRLMFNSLSAPASLADFSVSPKWSLDNTTVCCVEFCIYLRNLTWVVSRNLTALMIWGIIESQNPLSRPRSTG